ncbi:hypothetical protein H0H93_005849 [Arthromyces matolae]|nr:hypothetical protein H0H93_005849 [Arthromyces matolae]
MINPCPPSELDKSITLLVGGFMPFDPRITPQPHHPGLTAGKARKGNTRLPV